MALNLVSDEFEQLEAINLARRWNHDQWTPARVLVAYVDRGGLVVDDDEPIRDVIDFQYALKVMHDAGRIEFLEENPLMEVAEALEKKFAEEK